MRPLRWVTLFSITLTFVAASGCGKDESKGTPRLQNPATGKVAGPADPGKGGGASPKPSVSKVE
jgi:hypothetical protein